MLYAEIFIDGEWKALYLQSGTSISMEHRSWVFDKEAGGTFSHSFQISLDANIHIFGNSSDINGNKIMSVINNQPARLVISDGFNFFGKIRTDDELSVEEGSIDIEFVCGNQDLSDMVKDMNCQDVEVKDNICVGTIMDRIDIQAKIYYKGETYYEPLSIEVLPSVFTSQLYANTDGTWINSSNVSEAYPDKPYCNTRICIQRREKKDDGSYETTREYEVFEADRPDSGVCFYVLYFFDCLFAKLGIAFDNTSLRAMEDFCRLAFFTTQCHYNEEPYKGTLSNFDLFKDIFESGPSFVEPNTNREPAYCMEDHIWRPNCKYKMANSKNFPNEKVDSVIKAMQDAFGVRFIFSSNNRKCKAYLLKDILRDTNIHDAKGFLVGTEKAETSIGGIVMSYGGGEDDTNYHYYLTDSPVVKLGFQDIRSKATNPQDKNAYYDSLTGNLYRIKVDDDDAEKEEELYPSLFEVGAFQDFWIGDKDSSTAERIELPFKPSIENIIEFTTPETSIGNLSSTITRSRGDNQDENSSCKYAIFVDKELDAGQTIKLGRDFHLQGKDLSGKIHVPELRFYMEFMQRSGYDQKSLLALDLYSQGRILTDYKSEKDYKYRRIRTGDSKPLLRLTESPFADYDSGFTLMIMRGPGNKSGIETFDGDYDGEGNSKYQFVSADYNSCSDAIDQYGNAFDYNGTAEGGVDYSGRFSLKPSAKKRRNVGFENGRVDTREGAKAWLINVPGFFNVQASRITDIPLSLTDMRLVQGKALLDAGWSVEDSSKFYGTYPVASVEMQSVHSGKVWFIVNAFSATGEILTPTILNECLKGTDDNTVIYNKRYLLRKFAICSGSGDIPWSNKVEQNVYDDLIGLTDVFYGLKVFYDLKYMLPDSIEKFYPIDSAWANRGLFDTFYLEYAYFMMNKQEVKFKWRCEFAELQYMLEHLDWKWRFSHYVGYIYSISYDLSEEDKLADLQITFWYL